MKAPANSLHFTTENFCVRPGLDLWVEVKTARQRRETQPALDWLWIHVAGQRDALASPYFLARAVAEHSGLGHMVHAEGPDPESAILSATQKLKRALAVEARGAKSAGVRPRRRSPLRSKDIEGSFLQETGRMPQGAQSS